MTKSEALYNFFSGFGLAAYPASAVPDATEIEWPYLTYDNTFAGFGDVVPITVNLWFHTESEKVPNDKAEALFESIGDGGVQIAYDTGVIWIRRGSPFCNSLADETDSSIKRRIINLEIEFL